MATAVTMTRVSGRRQQLGLVGVSAPSCGSGITPCGRPQTTRWNIHIMYQAAKMTTEKVSRATHWLYFQAPRATRNSPTNPESPGRPIEANMKSTKKAD